MTVKKCPDLLHSCGKSWQFSYDWEFLVRIKIGMYLILKCFQRNAIVNSKFTLSKMWMVWVTSYNDCCILWQSGSHAVWVWKHWSPCSSSCVFVEYCEAEMMQTIRNLSHVRVLCFMTKSFRSCRMKRTQKLILKYLLLIPSFKKHTYSLAGVAQWLTIVPCTKRSMVLFLDRAHDRVACSIPSRGSAGGR